MGLKLNKTEIINKIVKLHMSDVAFKKNTVYVVLDKYWSNHQNDSLRKMTFNQKWSIASDIDKQIKNVINSVDAININMEDK